MDDRRAFIEGLGQGLAALGLECTDERAEQLWRHFELLRAANAEVNLTRIVQPAEAAVRHVADSLAGAAWLDKHAAEPLALLDIGTGGGFPGLPLAIMRPKWDIAVIDGTSRKVACVQRFINELGLPRCAAHHVRAEHWQGTADFDVLLFRAVGSLALCLRKARRVARTGTLVLCYKSTPLADGEWQASQATGIRRHFDHVENWAYELPAAGETLRRQLCVFRCCVGSPDSPTRL